MKYLAIAGLLIILILGCTQNEQESNLNCNTYCTSLAHADCVGSWVISGEYPNCACEWKCSELTPSCITSWNCTDWSECSINGNSMRVCTDLNNCNTSEGKPEETQTCTFENPCESVSDSSIKSECNVILLEDPSYCQENSYENCVYDLAKITFNISLCESINNSYLRNSCKAIVKNDRSYCLILEPSLRDLCYNSIDYFLNNRAVIEEDNYYCNLISSITVKNNCKQLIINNEELDYVTNHSKCEKLKFDYNSTDYQEIFACYVYHVKKRVDSCQGIINVVNLTDEFYDECKSLFNYNITHCYDLNGSLRDRCFAHFAYIRNDPLICRDSYSNDQCLSIVGNYFGLVNFCEKISSESLKNTCVYKVGTFCSSYDWGTCNEDYCKLITNNNGLKDACIYNAIRENIQRQRSFKDSIT